MNRFLLTRNEKLCSGCYNCVNSCPTNCISMKINEEGFFYPEFNDADCIKCGICISVCHMQHVPKFNKQNQHFYAAISKDLKSIKRSSSGGVFYQIANKILEEQGVVYGAKLDIKERHLHHCGINQVDDISQLQGSKYIQSQLYDTFVNIKSDLSAKRKILFVGTPCQVDALYYFLGKKNIDSLVTIDLLCHGVPSERMFREYVLYLENKHKGELVDINFRDKEKFGWSITLSYDIKKKNKVKRHYTPAAISPYFFSFLRGYILRENCYNCQFSSINRVGDITLADFWGVENALPSIEKDKGVSLVIINTEKGQRIFDDLATTLHIYEVSKEEATCQNPNFFEATKRPLEREVIFKELNNLGYKKIYKKYLLNPRRFKTLIKTSFLWKFYKQYIKGN
ncbi:MAG: Coenzyme F420 hydrogenase/dehydrogenase, beta subunit C-terminal domain [Vulcanibacillus sp.]